MKGAFSRQLLEEVSQQVAADEVPQPLADGGGGDTFAPGSETNEILVFPVGSALLRSEDGVEYAYIFSQRSITRDGTVFPEVVQTWIFDTDDALVAPNVVLIESIVSDDSIAVAGGQADVTLRHDVTGVTQTNVQTDFYRLEAQYSGLAYWIAHSDAYFGSAEYVADDFRMGFYGLATPSSGQPVLGLAAYEGKVFGSYTTVAAADRFLIGGDIELLVDFDAGEVSGEASLEAYTTALVRTDSESKVVIELAADSIGSDGSFESSNVSVMTDGAGTGVLIGLTEDLPPSGAAELFKGMFTGPETDEVVGRADLVGTGYALRFGFVAQEVEVEAEEIPEVIITKIEQDLRERETEQPTAKPGQNFEEDTNTTVVFPTEEEEAIVRTNNGNTFVLIFEEENDEDVTVVQTWTFNTSDPAQTVADNVSEIQGILGTSLDISGSRSEVKRRDSEREEQTLNADVYLFEGSNAGFGLWVERPEGFFGSGNYSPGGTPVAVRFYGLATPSADLPSSGTAAYAGQAAGAFVRNYISGTVAAADRFTIGGDIELEADFGNSTLGGTAELQAYTTAFAVTDPVSEVSIGLLNGLIASDSVSFSGSVAISQAGTGSLIGFTADLSPVQAGFSGIFAGPAADETVGRAEFRTGTLALQFGFAASQQSTHVPTSPVAASVLADVRDRLDRDEAIAQPTAGSESFDAPTSSDLAFPASASSSIIRSTDGTEYIYAFRATGGVQAWRFAVGTEAVAGNVARISNILNSSEVQVVGSRANARQGSSTSNIDSYIFEGSYAGFGLIVQEPEEFFGSRVYDVSDLRIGLHVYGLATSASFLPQAGFATYEGKAAGSFARNISNTGTVAAAHRFVVSGDVNLQASFVAGSIAGSVDLIAHSLDLSTQSQGALMLMLDRGTIQANGSFAGSASVKAGSDRAFAFFTPDRELSESSGYTGQIAGGGSQEIYGRVQLSAGSSNLQVGFLTVRENEFAGITPSVLSATRTSVDAGTTIPQPPAGSESFGSGTANDLTFPAGDDDAVIRSKDGSEYAYVFKEGDSTQVWTFTVSEPGTAAAAKARSLRDLAGAGYSVAGGRDPAADGYVIERRYSGLGIWAQGAADAFFGSGSYSSADLDLSIYGLATPPTGIPESVALYVGRAFGVYLKNIQQDGSAAAPDRFVVSGTVEIEADFEQNALGGSVQLVAHRLTSVAEISGSGATIELAETSQTSGRFDGDASVQSAQGIFASLTGVSLASSSGYSGFLAGPAADELVGEALLLASDDSQRLEFGFIGEFFNVIPIDDETLEATEAKVMAGDEIAQPEAASEDFDALTAEPIVFPASDGAAIVRSRDGFEYAYIFREGTPAAARTWYFSASGRSAVSSRVTSIRAGLHEDIEAYGLRSEVTRLDASDAEETFDTDIYVLDASHAGVGLWVEKPDEFFGSGTYSTSGTPVGAVFYGLTPATNPSSGTAAYAGSAIGGYMRNIQGDGTVAAVDRFLVSGDVELTADFSSRLIIGSADLTAHSLDLSQDRGTVGIGLSGSIGSDTGFAGSVQITTGGTAQLIALSLGLSADSSEFSGLIAGPAAENVAGRAIFRAADQALLFGFVASGQANIPTSPIAASVLTNAQSNVDSGTAIAQPAAGNETFGSATAADLTFPTAGGSALIRSTDGSEYAYVFKADGAVHTWRFAVGNPSAADNVSKIADRLNSSDIDVLGARSIVSRGDSIFSADAYIFESAYSGFGLIAEEPDKFFDSSSNDYQARRVGVRHYGLAAPAAVGFASYTGNAAGGYMRNIQGDGTAAGDDRFVISGTVALTADFSNDALLGSADLVAHSLSIAAASLGTVKIGLSGGLSSGNADVQAMGTDALIGLTAGLAHDEGSGLYSSLLAGTAGQEFAASVEFVAGDQGLLFGFIASQGTVSTPTTPIAVSVLTSARSNVDSGTAIAQLTAGNETFGSATVADLTFPTFGGSALIRSRDGSEYAHVFRVDSAVYAWRFAAGNQAAAANVTEIIARLNSTEIEVFGARSIVSQGASIFSVDAYIFEGAYSGFGLYAEEPEKFFDISSDDYQSRRVGVRHYGWAAPAAAAGIAFYAGKAAGGYMRNVQGDGTAAGSDRFVISGTVELTADFGNAAILGSADLVAHNLDISAASQGTVKIVISGGLSSGNVDVQTRGTDALSALTAGMEHDEGSGLYSGLLAGPTAQEYAASVEFVAGNQGLLFGFIAPQSSSSTPSMPIAASVLSDVRSKVDSGTAIAQLPAGTETFDSATATDLTFVVSGGDALIRSKDGSEYALVPLETESRTVFRVTKVVQSTFCAGGFNLPFVLDATSFPVCVNPSISLGFAISIVDGAVICRNTLNDNACDPADTGLAYEPIIADVAVPSPDLWRFASGDQDAAANVVNITARLNSTEIEVFGARNIVSSEGSYFSADAYFFERAYSGFALFVEDSEKFFDSSSDEYLASGVSVVSYGFADSSAAGYASYTGEAAGSYMRNVQSNGTVAAADRFVLSGEIALTADLLNDTISGSADLIAHSLDISATRRGEIKIGISGSLADGDVDILTTGTEILGGLTANLGHDAGSGVYASQLAGGTGQEYAASAEFLSGSQSLVFGFTAAQSAAFVNIPSGPIASSVLTDTNTKVDAGTNIAVPIAGNESFDPDTPTANDVVLQNTDGGNAVIRSKDGSEYAFVFKKSSPARLLSWRFASNTPQLSQRISKIHAFDSSSARTIGSNAQVKDGDNIFDVNAFVFEQSYSGFAVLLEDPEVFFDDSLAYDTGGGTRTSTFAYGLRPAEGITSGYGNYSGRVFGTYVDGITNSQAPGANRYVIRGDADFEVDFRENDLLGLIEFSLRDLDLATVSSVLQLNVRVTNARDFLRTTRSTTQFSLGTRFGPFETSISLITTPELNLGFFDPQAGQISGTGYLAGTNASRDRGFELHFGFIASDEDAELVTPITQDNLNTAFENSRVHKITDFPKAAGANLDSLADTAFFPNSDVQMLGRSSDGTELYTRWTSAVPQFDTDENKLVFTEKNITGTCDDLDELEKGSGNSCDGRNNPDADEVFAFTIDYSDRVSCLVTNALTSRYSNGDSCDLDDIAMAIAYTEGFGATGRNIDQWYFSPSSSRSSSNLRLRNITQRLGDPDDIDITASRTNLLNNSVSAEAFFLEAEYAGFALFITGGSNSFFGTANYNDPDIALRPLFYGLEAPVVTDSYTATYEGKAIGAYMRDISGSGTNRTVDDGDRAFITGEVELTADFAESTITGSAALVARRLNITDFVRGRVEIGFENGVIDGSSFAGDVAIETAGTNFLDDLSGGLDPDNISGFEGVIAGTGIQEISGRAIFRRNNIHILQFGFVANSTTDTIPSWVAATSVVEAAKTKLDAGDSIAQPEANSTDVFGSDTPTANTLTFPVADGALVRSPDGSEYALLPLNEDVLETVGFSISGNSCVLLNLTPVLVLNDDDTFCQAIVGSFLAYFNYASGSVTCTVALAGQLSSKYNVNDTCDPADAAVVLTETIGPSGDFTANIWRFGGSPPQAVADNASNINTIINSSAIRVLGARSNVSKNNDTLDVDAYILESTYAGFGIWAENPEDLFDGTDGTYTADELSIRFYGMATPAASIPTTGSASYSGKSFGIHMRDTNTDSLGFRFLISSDISATADFTDRSVSMTFGTISAYELDYTPTTAVGTAQLTAFDVSITASSPDITGKIKVTESTAGTGVLSDFTNPSAVAEGTISGILAGPNHDEMAGTASLTEGGDILKLGFIAGKQ